MAETNPNTRLEAFCDGIFAIAITLLIIDIKIPATAEISNTADFLHALKHIAPSIFAFVLSFIVILITWVNHHACLRLVNKSSPSFIYANGFLMLTVAFVPFPTSLLGEYILTDVAAPAVSLYNAITALQGFSWVLMSSTALKNRLTKNEVSAKNMQTNKVNGFYAIAVYSLLAILAIWFPLSIAVITALTWIFWLIFGIKMKHE